MLSFVEHATVDCNKQSNILIKYKKETLFFIYLYKKRDILKYIYFVYVLVYISTFTERMILISV